MFYIGHILFLLVLLAFSAFFSGSETAIFSLTDLERKRLVSHGTPGAQSAVSLLDDPRRTLITILIGNMLVNITASAVATLLALRIFGNEGIGIVIGLFTFLLLMVGEITPKAIAVRNNETLARFVARPLKFFVKLFRPIRYLVDAVAGRLLSVVSVEKAATVSALSEDEIRGLISVSEEEGIIDEDEKKRIHKLLDFGERMVKEIMKPRTDIVAFNIRDGAQALIAFAEKHRLAYIPVYRDSLDKLMGILSAQEFMLSDRSALKPFLKLVFYIPETKRIDDLLFEFVKSKRTFAMCVDEYGGTAGLVTLEDILEEIFGEIYGEDEREEVLSRKLSKTSWEVSGAMGLLDFSELIHKKVSSEAAETVGGFIFLLFGMIPERGAVIEAHGMRFTVLDVRRRRIKRIKVQLLKGK